MRIVFAGTPEPAVVALEALLASQHEVVAVITRPDAPRGRGRTLAPSAVKEVAQAAGIEVLTPASVAADSPDGQQLRERLAQLRPDAIPVVAYGQLIGEDLLAAAPHGWINLHFSLLPAWRGAAPVQAAIAAGDEVTGASTFQIEAGLDTGPVFAQITEPIGTGDTAADLLGRLADSGAQLLVQTLDGIESGQLHAQPQQGTPSYAPKITVDAARIDWHLSAAQIQRHIRAVSPAPGAWTQWNEQRFKIAPLSGAAPGSQEASGSQEAPGPQLAPGQVQWTKTEVWVGTGTEPLLLSEVQPPNKKRMAATDWARGLSGRGDDMEVRFQ